MSKFANSYWSSDYKTGIDQLTRQSTRSIQQLHELHQLIFNYMNHYSKNGDSLHKICVDSYPFESSFRPYNPNVKATLASPRNTLKRISDSFRSLNIGPSPVMPTTSLEIPAKQDGPTTMNTSYELYISNLNKQSQSMTSLAILIDREVLEKISVFIKTYEPQVRAIVDDLNTLYTEYEEGSQTLESLKVDYDELINMKGNMLDADVLESPPPPVPEKELPQLPQVSEEETIDHPVGFTDLKFPVPIGPMRLLNYQELSSVLKKLILLLTTVKKRIPIPGYKNDIFSSDQLSVFLTKFKPFNFNPTRMNIEKFGQSLLDHKFLVSSNFFIASKFKSEGMWFEWSELALYLSEDRVDVFPRVNTAVERTEERTPKHGNSPKKEITPTIGVTPAFMSNTSKMFHSLLLNKANYSTKLSEIEEAYKENYYNLQGVQNELNRKITNNSAFLETFETAKINLFYSKLATLSELTYNHHLQLTTGLHSFTSNFIESINTQESRDNDFDQLLATFSTGIYFPTSSLHFQNLKNQFNLFKDVQLQVKLDGELLSTSSVPIFVYELVKTISKDAPNQESKRVLASSWASPVLQDEYWQLKQEIISVINDFEVFEIAQESIIHTQILVEIGKYFESISPDSGINFLKNWLLEMKDSLIPCMIYDAVVNLYKVNGNEDPMSLDTASRRSELIRLLSTIPRSNLSTLIYLLEHVASVFGTITLPDYGVVDEIKEPQSKEINVGEISNVLNSMDQIGSVPFVHFILRPSILKNSTGFKPPLPIYKSIITDLLNVEFRYKLYEILLAHESKFKIKKEQEAERFKLQVKKLPLSSPPTSKLAESGLVSSRSLSGIASPIPKNGATPALTIPENFSLRPFKTRATPNPSPSTSPLHTPTTSVDLSSGAKLKRLKETLQPPIREGGRARSGSGSLLLSGVNVEYGE